MTRGVLVIPGPEASDDGEITESHAEPGEWLKISPLIPEEPGCKIRLFTMFPGTAEAQGGQERQSGL